MLSMKICLAILGLGFCPAVLLAAVTPCVPDDLSGIAPIPNIDFAATIQPIINTRCGGCHTGFAALGGLNMNKEVAVGHLVNVPSTNARAGMPRVTPGDPDNSYLFRKINCANLDAIPGQPFGSRMPMTPQFLSTTDQAAIRDWIQQGALAAPTAHQPIKIAGYMSGNWFNPDQGGHGFQIEAATNNTMVAIWFVYSPDGSRQNWIFAQGDYDKGTSSTTLPAVTLSGARFPPNFDSRDISANVWGSITFSFSDCNHGTVSWHSELPGYDQANDKPLPITRLTQIDGTECPQ